MKTAILTYLNYFINTWKHLDKETFAYDERIKDSRDLHISELAGNWEFEDMPAQFEVQDGEFQNQFVEGYKMSCTGMSATNAVNNSHSIKHIPDRYSGFELFDIAVDLDLASRVKWAYTIHLIKLAKALKYIIRYYQCNTVQEIKLAIYKGLNVCSGSNKINWQECKYDGLVKRKSTGSGHAFCIVGWDDEKIIWNYIWALKCENSYGKDYMDKWCFRIPYDIAIDVLHNTKKALLTKKTTDT